MCMAFHSPAGAASRIDLFTDQSAGLGQSDLDRNHVTRSSAVQINPAFIESIAGIETSIDLSSLHLNLTPFFESPMVIIFKRLERVSSTSLALIGTIQGVPGSEAIFLTNG